MCTESRATPPSLSPKHTAVHFYADNFQSYRYSFPQNERFEIFFECTLLYQIHTYAQPIAQPLFEFDKLQQTERSVVQFDQHVQIAFSPGLTPHIRPEQRQRDNAKPLSQFG